MAILGIQENSRAGISLVHNACAGGGDSFVNDGMTSLYFRNGNIAARTVTVAIQQSIEGQTPTGRQYTVPANSDLMIAPFAPPQYNDANKRTNLAYNAVTDLTVALIRNRL